jgi:hypothetical protein
MGKLTQNNQECVGVSLSQSTIKKLRNFLPARVEINGFLYQVPQDIEISNISIDGREIGFQQCNGKYVVVGNSSNIELISN